MATFLSKYALAPVPRYTSYPPATQFSGVVGAGDYRGWLAGVTPADSLSLYVHVPFCQSLCWYCGCHTSVPNSADRAADYVAALRAEIALVAEAAPLRAPVRHLHFGGGTPNYLDAETLTGIIDLLMDNFPFSPDAEIAIEVDPRSLDPDHIRALANYTNVRISMGVQDVSSDVQQLINRMQPFDQVAEVVAQLRDAGITSINMDLMYGLPGQTVAHVQKSAEMAAGLGPDRFAVFGYAHVPWFKKHMRAIDEGLLPGGQERLDQMAAARDTLVGYGYDPIGLDHFARPDDALSKAIQAGTLRRNFQGYTADPANVLIGFGASAIGSLPQGYVQNEPNIKHYKEAVLAGRLPIVRGVALSAEDREVASVIENLMCNFAVDLGEGSFAGTDFSRALSSLAPLQSDGLVVVTGNAVTVTDIGRPYIRNIAACFDAYWEPSATRHSRAV